MSLSLNLAHQPSRRPSVSATSAPSHTTSGTSASYITRHSPSFKRKGKDRFLPVADSGPFGLGYRHGQRECLLLCLCPERTRGFSAELRLTRWRPCSQHDKADAYVPHDLPQLPFYKDTDHFDSKSSDSSPSVAAHDSPLHSAPSLPSRHRMSILSVASDALGFRKKISSVSRKKPNVPHTSNIVPGVIEINNSTVTPSIGSTTAHKDYEHEERERLRDVAAQSIGLDPNLLRSSKSESRSLLDSPLSPTQPASIPPFPATSVALHPFIILSATFPKFTPPSSLLVYALAKQWKPRTIVLTSHSPSQKTHVHLFKGASRDEKEVERLEVTEDSVIFVAEEQVGGRGNVVKFAGKDVSPKQSGEIGEEGSRTMWLLQIKDAAESHRWITAIKNAVLTQRAVRAGLDIPSQIEGRNEPKGDMDVMLSMHLQRIMSTHPLKTSPAISPPSPLIPVSPSPPPSLRSLRINTSSLPSPTVASRGVFSGTRPRSPSVEGSPTLTYSPGHAEDSFSAAGTSLLTMLRTKSSTDSSSLPSHSLPVSLSHVPRQGSPVPSLRSISAPVVIAASELKISKERDVREPSTSNPEASSSSTISGSDTPPTPSLLPQGTLTYSLQPPPRKCKHAVPTMPTTCLQEPQGMYKQANGNHSVAGNFGILSRNPDGVTPGGTPPASPGSPDFSGGRSETFSSNSVCGMSSPVVVETFAGEQNSEVVRTSSEDSIVNSSPPGIGSVPTDKLLQGPAFAKRWSRQGVPLPKQLIPPSGPPPSIPPSPENNHRFSVESTISIPVANVLDRSPSSSSSNFHSRARISPRSGSSLSPTFWKRASGSSTHSGSSTSASDSHNRSQIQVPSADESFPPSLESIASNRGPLRPMSLSVYSSSPVVHIGTTKRRSMPPPRPAPNFAPPPAPTVREFKSKPAPLTTLPPPQQKSFRSSVAQRALRLSLTSPKPPPSSALPPRPDEATFVQGHRRNSSTDAPNIHPIPTTSSRPTSSLLRNPNSIQCIPPPRSFSIRQRLRILSTPPAQPPSALIPSIQVSTLDLSDDNDDDPPTPYFSSPQPFGLGEHITTIQDDPSFLQLSTPITPTTPKPPSRSPFRPVSPFSGAMSGFRSLPLEPDRDFVALSPPPRRDCKPHVVTATRPEKLEVERSGSGQREESKLLALSQRGSVVSLGFVST